MCRRKGGEDWVQDVFASYGEPIKQGRLLPLPSFLYKGLENRCLDYLKHRGIVADYEAEIRNTLFADRPGRMG